MQEFPSTEAKDKWGILVESALQKPVTITKHGRPSLILTSVQDYKELQRIKYNKLKADIRAGIEAAERGDFSTITIDEIKAEARRRFEAKRKA